MIDLFAGPGGLGEGFAQWPDRYRIAISIEKDRLAHQTLRLRAFYRQFERRNVPEEYYAFLRKEITLDELWNCATVESSAADREAWLCELGETPHKQVREWISEALAGFDRPSVLIGG